MIRSSGSVWFSYWSNKHINRRRVPTLFILSSQIIPIFDALQSIQKFSENYVLLVGGWWRLVMYKLMMQKVPLTRHNKKSFFHTNTVHRSIKIFRLILNPDHHQDPNPPEILHLLLRRHGRALCGTLIKLLDGQAQEEKRRATSAKILAIRTLRLRFATIVLPTISH